MASTYSTFNKETTGSTDIIDITGQVAAIVGKSSILNGSVNIFVAGSTAALTTIEYESGVINDLKNEDPQVREEAARALGKTADSQALEALFTALQDEDSSVRWNAAMALGEIEDPRVIKPLFAAMKHEDLATVSGAYKFFIRKGEPGTEDILIHALNKYGDYTIALAFFESGNSKLEKAAKKWLKGNLYPTLSPAGGNGELRWGKGR